MNSKGVAAVLSTVALFTLPWRSPQSGSADRSGAQPVQPSGASAQAVLAQRESNGPSAMPRALSGRLAIPSSAATALSEKPPRGSQAPSPEGPPAAELGQTTAHLKVSLTDAAGNPVTHPVEMELRSGFDGSTRAVTLSNASAAGDFGIDIGTGATDLVVWHGDQLGGPVSIEVQADETYAVRIVLRAAASVAGRVTDERDGSNIQGASVSFWTFSDADVAKTELNGVFHHPRFPAGTGLHQVRVEAPGYGALVRYLSVDHDGRWALYSNLAERADISGRDGQPWVELQLKASSPLSGFLYNEDGQPIPGARVQAEGYLRTLDGVATCDSADTLSDSSGYFRLEGLRADLGHAVQVHASGYAVQVRELRAGHSATQEWVLRRGRSVAGTILDPLGLPSAGVTVELLDPAQEQPSELSTMDAGLRLETNRRRTLTDSLGTFSFDDAPDHALLLRARGIHGQALSHHFPHGNATRLVLQMPSDCDLTEADSSALAVVEQP